MKLQKIMLTGCLLVAFIVMNGCGMDEDESEFNTATLGGVWMSFSATGGSGFSNVRWIVFDGEGYLIDDLPRAGLHGITESELLTYTLGTYTVTGRTIDARTPYTSYAFEWTDINTLTREGYTYKFYRCIVKDNLRLSGSWTTYSNTSDPWLDESGARPVLTLNSDGTFTDRGLWVTNFIYPNAEPQNSPGTGTYQIIDFSLVLTYSDGRLIKRSFTGAVSQDPEKNSTMLYISNNAVHKR